MKYVLSKNTMYKTLSSKHPKIHKKKLNSKHIYSRLYLDLGYIFIDILKQTNKIKVHNNG